MPRSRFLNLAPEARERLLGVATKHFAERGFERASLNEILAEAGISKGAYYYYFDDKDDLFATTLESATDALLARLPIPPFERLTRETFWPTVERFVGLTCNVFPVTAQLEAGSGPLRPGESYKSSPGQVTRNLARLTGALPQVVIPQNGTAVIDGPLSGWVRSAAAVPCWQTVTDLYGSRGKTPCRLPACPLLERIGGWASKSRLNSRVTPGKQRSSTGVRQERPRQRPGTRVALLERDDESCLRTPRR